MSSCNFYLLFVLQFNCLSEIIGGKVRISYGKLYLLVSILKDSRPQKFSTIPPAITFKEATN